ILRRTGVLFFVYLAIVGSVFLLFHSTPTSFLPEEDQGYFISAIQLPVGATRERALEVIEKVENYYLTKETNVEKIIMVSGISFNGRGQNNALSFVRLKDWSERSQAWQKVQAVIGRSYGFFAQIKEALIFAFNPPSIPELGTATGISFQLQDQGGLGHEKLIAARNMILGMGAQDPTFKYIRPSGLEDSPVLRVDIDQEKSSSFGLSIKEINNTLQTAFGSSYVNNFVHQGRVQKVYLQGDALFRMNETNLYEWFVRSKDNVMVPFSAFAKHHWSLSSPQLERYNGTSSVGLSAEAAPGKSTGEAMLAIEKMVRKLPAGIGLAWSDQSYQERLSNEQTPYLFAISIFIVFLCLAALYESWVIPISVILVVPLGVLGTLLAVKLFGLSNDVYLKVGVLMTIGLSAKNAILIVEFAKTLCEQGKDLIDATIEAAYLRLRPILMTSLAFIFGVLPLAISNGAGSASQNAIGIGVIGGMITATFLAIFFVPVFFVTIMSLFKKNHPKISSSNKNECRLKVERF
ncbi:MAG: efflux RND transporter permease subunit, partial [Silvanigrellaceae bacterium]|nr:efflux RND transporter permease subunit [Silvanigrellaceae bacterium]